jgi:hypothetical protein
VENPFSLPEGYIFAFLISASTFTESALLDSRYDNPLLECLRILAIVTSLVFAIFSVLFYVSMLSANHAPQLVTMQLPVAALSGVVNLLFLWLKIAKHYS